MKKIYTVLVLLFLYFTVSAGPTIYSTPTSGNWNNASTWSLNRTPQDGDTVIIPVGKTVLITDIQNYSASNLYIKIYGTLDINNGKLWLGPSSIIWLYTGGMILASGSPSETLKIGGDTKFQGTQGSLSGPAIANSGSGSAPTGFTPFSESPLPVKFIGFNLARQGNDVLVQWATAEELNNHYFEIQRSENASNWSVVGNVNGAGDSRGVNSYSYTDKNATAKVLYYRIRQVDLDGKSTTTVVRMIKSDATSADIKISSSTSNSVYIHFSQKINSSVTVKLLSSNGQQIGQQTLSNPVGQVIIPVTGSSKGIYIVTVTDGKGLQFSQQVLL